MDELAVFTDNSAAVSKFLKAICLYSYRFHTCWINQKKNVLARDHRANQKRGTSVVLSLSFEGVDGSCLNSFLFQATAVLAKTLWGASSEWGGNNK